MGKSFLKSSIKITKMLSICRESSFQTMWYDGGEGKENGEISRAVVLVFLTQIAVPDLVESVKGADILVFVLPHQVTFFFERERKRERGVLVFSQLD